jgi:flagellar FliL protein
MNAKLIIAFAGVALASAAAAGTAIWYMTPTQGAAEAPKKAAPQKKPVKYVTLDKVIVMLRRAPNEPATHYLAADLVLATTDKQEKETKEHLPLLRSIAVSALSAHTLAEASSMSVDQYAAELNKTFDASYAEENREKPFSEVMIGKLIIE